MSGRRDGASCEKLKTYIARGNVVFRSGRSDDQVRSALEDQVHAYAGKGVGVIVRTASEIGDALARNPSADAPSNRVMAFFTESALHAAPFNGVTVLKEEQARAHPVYSAALPYTRARPALA